MVAKEGIRDFSSLQARSDYLNLEAQVTNPDPVNGPAFLARPYVSPTNFTEGGVLLQTGSAVDHIEFLPDGSGQFRPLPFSGVGVLSGGCNCQARPSLEYGIDRDYEVDTPADRGVAFAHYDHELGDRNSFYLETLLANSSQANVWQSAALLGPWAGRIYADNRFLPAALEPVADRRPAIRGLEFSRRTSRATVRHRGLIAGIARSTVAGFSHDMGDDFLRGNWVLDSYVQYAQNRQETVVPAACADLLPIAMDVVTVPAANPCR
jgi:hypothetical protein